MQENPRQAFASWVQSLEKAYQDNVEVLTLTCPSAALARLSVPAYHARKCLILASEFDVIQVPCLQEYERRFLVWLDNMEYAQAHNEKQSSFKVHYRCIAACQSMPL